METDNPDCTEQRGVVNYNTEIKLILIMKFLGEKKEGSSPIREQADRMVSGMKYEGLGGEQTYRRTDVPN